MHAGEGSSPLLLLSHNAEEISVRQTSVSAPLFVPGQHHLGGDCRLEGGHPYEGRNSQEGIRPLSSCASGTSSEKGESSDVRFLSNRWHRPFGIYSFDGGTFFGMADPVGDFFLFTGTVIRSREMMPSFCMRVLLFLLPGRASERCRHLHPASGDLLPPCIYACFI